jgi:hypothetical protein
MRCILVLTNRLPVFAIAPCRWDIRFHVEPDTEGLRAQGEQASSFARTQIAL